jgi:hypothetical protein
MIETTFTTTEIEALAEAFDDWSWTKDSLEPDARVDVLYCESLDGGLFLMRHNEFWRWAKTSDGMGKRGELSPVRDWNEQIGYLNGSEYLRIPTAEELRAGGWTIEEVDVDEETQPLATSALLGARDLLEREDSRPPTTSEIFEANALALTSIAATLHDLSVLIEDEFAWRRSQRPAQGTEAEEESEDDSAHRSLGPGEDPDFSFSGR